MTNRIKLLHVIPTLDQSGTEKQVTLLASGLPQDRFEVKVCVLTRGGFYEKKLRDAGIAVEILGKRLKLDPGCFWKLRQRMLEFRPDIVHTWLFAGNCYGRLAAKTAKVPHIVASERCVDEWKSSYQFAVDRRLARWTEVLVANSQAVADFYCSRGIPPEKFRVIPNGVEESPLPAESDGTVDRELKALGVSSATKIIGFIGRLWPQKRVEDLLWATDVLRISGADIRVLILGDGPKRATLERFAQRLKIDSIVHFLGHRENIAEWLRRIDVVVLPSEFEGMPNVALEAMQAGKPVVASRIAGLDEVVVDGMTGVLVEPKEPFLLAKAISKVITNDELRQRLGQTGKRFVHERFAVSQMIEQYSRLYEKLCGKA